MAASMIYVPPPGDDDDTTTNMKLRWNALKVDLDETHGSAVFEVAAVKTLQKKDQNGTVIEEDNFIYY